MKKFIFISVAKTTNSMIERFYLDTMDENGLDIEYWDIRSLYFDENKDYQCNFIKKIISIEEFKKNLNSLNFDDTLINLQLDYSFKYLKLFYLIRKFKTSFFAIGFFPTYQATSRKFLEKLRRGFSKRLFFKLITIITKKIIVKDFDVLFYSGLKAKEVYFAKKYYPINYIDYEKVNKIQYENNKYNYRYCVFLDCNLIAHPDTKDIGLNFINKDKYMKQLNELFKYIKENFSLTVLLALHPTSDYYEFWPKKYQFRAETDKLVKSCEFVISHHSTAICLAISAYKKILLVFSKEIYSKLPYTISIIDGLSKELNLLKISLDEKLTFKTLKKVDKRLYKNFLYKFCISKFTENKFAREYLKDYMKEI